MGYFSGQGMRKPYLSTSNYILKMSDYKRDGTWDTLWTALFYGFIRKKPPAYISFYRRNLAHSGNVSGGSDASKFLDRHFTSALSTKRNTPVPIT